MRNLRFMIVITALMWVFGAVMLPFILIRRRSTGMLPARLMAMAVLGLSPSSRRRSRRSWLRSLRSYHGSIRAGRGMLPFRAHMH